MLKVLGSLLIGSLFFLPSTHTHLKDSIRPLSWTSPAVMQVGPFTVEDEDAPPVVKNHCTIWAYHSPTHPQVTHWITAAHCILDDESGHVEDRDYQIMGVMVYPESWRRDDDIASLVGEGASAPGLELAKSQPAVEEFVKGAGHPYGLPFLVTVRGTVAAIDAHFMGDPDGVFYNIYELPVAPGNSGGPVLDSSNHVIGLTQIGFSGYSPMSGGLALSKIQAFLSHLS